MKIKEFINKNLYKIAAAALIVILLSIIVSQCHNARIANNKLKVAEQNIEALNDTLHLTRTKDNKPEFDKLAFLTDKVANLEKLDEALFKEVKATKGKVSTIINAGVQFVHDTTEVEVTTTLEGDDIISDFKHDTTYSKGNSRTIEGYTTYNLETEESQGFITKDSMNVSFVTGIKNLDKGKPEIFLRSNYPGFIVTDLSGAVLDPKLFSPKTKQKLLTFGLNVGWTPISYSFSSRKLDFDASRIGGSIGANINLSRLIKR